jgi:hypothetical protein
VKASIASVRSSSAAASERANSAGSGSIDGIMRDAAMSGKRQSESCAP